MVFLHGCFFDALAYYVWYVLPHDLIRSPGTRVQPRENRAKVLKIDLDEMHSSKTLWRADWGWDKCCSSGETPAREASIFLPSRPHGLDKESQTARERDATWGKDKLPEL